jgi:hypothetical protein
LIFIVLTAVVQAQPGAVADALPVETIFNATTD